MEFLPCESVGSKSGFVHLAIKMQSTYCVAVYVSFTPPLHHSYKWFEVWPVPGTFIAGLFQEKNYTVLHGLSNICIVMNIEGAIFGYHSYIHREFGYFHVV